MIGMINSKKTCATKPNAQVALDVPRCFKPASKTMKVMLKPLVRTCLRQIACMTSTSAVTRLMIVVENLATSARVLMGTKSNRTEHVDSLVVINRTNAAGQLVNMTAQNAVTRLMIVVENLATSARVLMGLPHIQ